MQNTTEPERLQAVFTWQGVKIDPGRVSTYPSSNLNDVRSTVQVCVRRHTCWLLLVPVDQQHQGLVRPKWGCPWCVLRHIELIAELPLQKNRGELVTNWKIVPFFKSRAQFCKTCCIRAIWDQSWGRSFLQMDWMGNRPSWPWLWVLKKKKPGLIKNLGCLTFGQVSCSPHRLDTPRLRWCCCSRRSSPPSSSSPPSTLRTCWKPARKCFNPI